MMRKILNYFTDHRNDLILLFTVTYMAAFTVNAYFDRNFEFLYYNFILVVLIYLVMMLTQKLHLGFFILFSLSLAGFIHLLGGNFYFADGTRLYDTYFFGGLLRYDNIVHTFGTFIATLTVYSLIADFIHDTIRDRYYVFALLLVLMAIGIGTVNEVVEFAAVQFLGAMEQVGGYFNTSWDLIFNIIGSILATIVIYVYRERPRFYRRLQERLARRTR